MIGNIDWETLCNGLWNNSRDSIRHALEHLRELATTKKNKAHHLKWSIMSVHQAAECFCNILFIQNNPNDPSLIRKGRPWFPSLRFIVDKLLSDSVRSNLSFGEIRLLHLLKELPGVRDRLMHGALPDDIDSSAAAQSLLGIIRIARRRFGEPVPEFECDSPRIEAEVFSVIPYQRMDEYCQVSERLLLEEYPNQHFGYCKNCGTQSILNGSCETCFEEMESIECPHCGEEDFFPSWEKIINSEVLCTYCGKNYTAYQAASSGRANSGAPLSRGVIHQT